MRSNTRNSFIVFAWLVAAAQASSLVSAASAFRASGAHRGRNETHSENGNNNITKLSPTIQNTEETRQTQKASLNSARLITTNRAIDHHQQQRQKQLRVQREISCDELNLIVRAKQTINATIASRFIECQHIDPSLGSEKSTKLELPLPSTGINHEPSVATSSVHSFNGTLENLQLAQQRPSAEFNAKKEQSHGELHFGAKVALAILASSVMLVLCATLTDVYSSDTTDNCSSEQSAETSGRSRRLAVKQQQQFAVRDQRSPSLSSTSSSTLCCSANSVASSSAPILGNQISSDTNSSTNKNNQKRYNFYWNRFGTNQKSPDNLDSQYYERNLQMHFSNDCSSQQVAEQTVLPPRQFDTPCQIATAKQSQQERFLLEAVQKAALWGRQGERIATPPVEQIGKPLFDRQLLRQVFLAFSLRHSTALIFQANEEQTTTTSKQQQHQHHRHQSTSPCLSRRLGKVSSCGGHRSRVSSLSSINESTSNTDTEYDRSNEFDEANYMINPAQSRENGHQTKTTRCSIDSLHGMRFLSMIWIIVIHSYDFALRWSFFTNTSPSDNIYKTAASQLLANGTFACDSFFFAAGFLLPYLAFPAKADTHSNSNGSNSCLVNNISASDDHHSNDNQQQQQQQASFAWMAPRSPTTGNIQVTTGNKLVMDAVCKSTSIPLANKQHDNSEARSSCCSMGAEQQVGNEDALNNLDTTIHCEHSRQAAANGTCLNLNPTCRSPHSSSGNINTATSTNISNIPLLTASNFANNGGRSKHGGTSLHTNEFTLSKLLANLLHRYVRMMPLMMAIIGLSATLLRYLGEGPVWDDSTMMFDKWCRKNWWKNALFLHNFITRENMCLSHSWYSAVDMQLFLIGQIILFVLFRSRLIGLLLCLVCLFGAQLVTGTLTLLHHLPAVPLISGASEQTMNLYYGEIYIKPYCRASPYLIGILLAYLMRTTSLGQIRLKRWQVITGWTVSLGTLMAILLAMQPAMNGQPPSELQSALYSALSRPLWACATGWMIFACITKHGGIFESILGARCFIPLSRLTYPAFLIHPIVMAVFYGSRQTSFHFSHYLMLYLILGNIVITYVSAFILSALFELPLLTAERAIKRAWSKRS